MDGNEVSTCSSKVTAKGLMFLTPGGADSLKLATHGQRPYLHSSSRRFPLHHTYLIHFSLIPLLKESFPVLVLHDHFPYYSLLCSSAGQGFGIPPRGFWKNRARCRRNPPWVSHSTPACPHLGAGQKPCLPLGLSDL